MQYVKVPDAASALRREAAILDRLARIKAMPPVKWLFGKDWSYGPWSYAFGLMWDKDPTPDEGAYIYRRRFVLRVNFQIAIERN